MNILYVIRDMSFVEPFGIMFCLLLQNKTGTRVHYL